MVPERVVAALARARRPVCAYVYDRATMLERAVATRAALPAGAHLLYAVKANGHPDLLAAMRAGAGSAGTAADSAMAGMDRSAIGVDGSAIGVDRSVVGVDGFEIASAGELALALSVGTAGETAAGTAVRGAAGEAARPGASGPGEIVFSGPGKTDEELRAAVRAGALVHVESAHELRRLALAAAEAWAGAALLSERSRSRGLVEASTPPAPPGRRAGAAGGDQVRPVRAALRVNRAGAGLPGSHQMTGTPTAFGIDEAELGQVAALAATLPEVRLVGFHLHAVSNNLDAAAHATFVTGAARWAVSAAGRYGVPLRYLNVGGGFGVDHTGGAEFDLAVFAAELARTKVRLPEATRLVFEPGRFLAAGAGWYAAQVLDLKLTHGRWFAVLRGGTHHFRLPAAWRYSHPFTVLPVDDWPYPFDRPEVRDVSVDAVGELCTPRDVLTRGQRVDRLRVGDVLVFARAGAYGWDISHHDFLRHPHPQMIIR